MTEINKADIKRGQVYLTTNLVNNKIYVEQSTLKNKAKVYLGSGILMLRAIKKYGKDNFKKEVLWEGETTQDDLNMLEREYISSQLKMEVSA